LTKGIYPSYCKETIRFKDTSYKLAVPMISFCDIPLSQINVHTEKYGSYAIGFTVEFVFSDWHEIMNNTDFEKFYNKTYINMLSLLSSIKNYDGTIKRRGKTIQYKFYDEREWRYIPKIKFEDEYRYPDLFWDDEFYKIKKTFPTKPHFKHYGLKINVKDISYIIVKEDKDLVNLIRFLKNRLHLYTKFGDYEKLLTRILTIKKIKEDF
jgi:Putative abortive phage resistance protein AbiGi, antitoxin